MFCVLLAIIDQFLVCFKIYYATAKSINFQRQIYDVIFVFHDGGHSFVVLSNDVIAKGKDRGN